MIGDAATTEDLLFRFASDIGTEFLEPETIFIHSSAKTSNLICPDAVSTDHITVVYLKIDALESFVKEQSRKVLCCFHGCFPHTARELFCKCWRITKLSIRLFPRSAELICTNGTKYFFGHDVVILPSAVLPDVLGVFLWLSKEVLIFLSGIHFYWSKTCYWNFRERATRK